MTDMRSVIDDICSFSLSAHPKIQFLYSCFLKPAPTAVLMSAELLTCGQNASDFFVSYKTALNFFLWVKITKAPNKIEFVTNEPKLMKRFSIALKFCPRPETVLSKL